MLRRVVWLVFLGCGFLALFLVTWRRPSRQSWIVGDPPVARVYNQFLYKSNLDHLAAETTNPEDRAEMIEQYIQSWITKQLIVAEAEASNKHKKRDIDRRVLDYRCDLLVHSFVEKLVNAQLNRVVSDKEIKDYYQARRGEFVLRHNIFRGKFVIIPKNSPTNTKLKTLLIAKKKAEQAALATYCAQFAKKYALDETVWLSWEELMPGIPFHNIGGKAKLSSGGRYFQTSDDRYLYYFKIDDYRLVDDISPLEFVSGQIADIVICKRKIDLANKLKKDILQKAQQSNHCVVYEH